MTIAWFEEVQSEVALKVAEFLGEARGGGGSGDWLLDWGWGMRLGGGYVVRLRFDVVLK